jgi:hypothetical protein
MNRFRNYALMAAGFAVLVVVVGVFTAGPVIAQAVRAALVSNVDDPGRIPYARSTNCTFDVSGLCETLLPLVPDGKRLVITHVSGLVEENLPGGTYLRVLVQTSGSSGDFASFVPTYIGSFVGSNTFVFDQSVLLFVDAGQYAVTSVSLGGSPSNSAAQFSLTGYMLDCSNSPCAKIAQ